MDNICSICNKPTNAYTKSDGQIVCMECASNLKKQQILEQASKSDDSSYFKDWSSKDRTTAFFEAFGHYVKEILIRYIIFGCGPYMMIKL